MTRRRSLRRWRKSSDEEILEDLEPEDRAALEASFAFDDETIGRLMQREFVAAPPFWTIGDTIDHMRETGENLPELFFNIWVIDTAFPPNWLCAGVKADAICPRGQPGGGDG